MSTYTSFFRRHVNAFKEFVTGCLVRCGVPANAITLAGLAISILAGVSFATGHFFSGGILIFLTGACDVFDGAVAKRSGNVSDFGAFFDSCLDRYSDIFLLGGAGFYYAVHGPLRNVLLAFLAIAGSTLTSYSRARAENIGLSCKVGFWERAERTFLIMVGGLFGRMPSILWELAIFTNITAVHRIYHVWRGLRKPSWKLPYVPILSDILFWEYPRYTWQYDVYVGLGILVPLLLPIQ